MKSKKFNWKPGIITLVALGGLFLILTGGIKSSKKFKVTHFAAVESTVGADGRAAVGSPEIYQVRISPALTWKLSKNNTGIWRALAWILIIACAGFILLYANDVITFGAGTNAANYIPFVLLVAAAACYFGAYSSAFTNNYRDLSKEQYEAVQGDQTKLTELFTLKDYIR